MAERITLTLVEIAIALVLFVIGAALTQGLNLPVWTAGLGLLPMFVFMTWRLRTPRVQLVSMALSVLLITVYFYVELEVFDLPLEKLPFWLFYANMVFPGLLCGALFASVNSVAAGWQREPVDGDT